MIKMTCTRNFVQTLNVIILKQDVLLVTRNLTESPYNICTQQQNDNLSTLHCKICSFYCVFHPFSSSCQLVITFFFFDAFCCRFRRHRTSNSIIVAFVHCNSVVHENILAAAKSKFKHVLFK